MNTWELEELCLFAGGKSEQEVEDFINQSEDIDIFCYDTFSVEFEEFCNIAQALLKLTPRIKTAINGTLMNAFVNKTDIGYVSIVQQEAKELTTSSKKEE